VAACVAAGARAAAFSFDVADSDAVEAGIAGIVETFGGLHGLFNNAGVQGVFARIDQYPIDDLHRVLSANVVGAFLVLGAASRAIIDSGGGSIVNTASMAGVSGAPNMPAYSMSKAAIVGLTKAAAKDLAPFGIRVNAVSPAFIGPGKMWDAQVLAQARAGSQYFPAEPEAVARQMLDSVPMRRYGALGEVASVVAFLMSDAASYLTGSNIEIAGGGN
jgi:NAD(P)-dependent dehydrogenase (short-subunit alcohol dehydrogenase family)